MANEIYSKSWWGSGVCFNTVGWGLVYKPYAGCGAVPALLLALETRATYYENETCTIATLQEIEAIAYTAPPVPTGLLVDYPNAFAAYSLRNLISTTTNVIRVRRSNDQAEQDFTAEQITDGTLTTWTGANDGFVPIWYNQATGYADLFTTTALDQPSIVQNGVLNLDNGKPYLAYNTIRNSRLSTGNQALIVPFDAFMTFNGSTANRHCMLGGASSTQYIGTMINSGALDTYSNVGAIPVIRHNGIAMSVISEPSMWNTFVTNSDELATISLAASSMYYIRPFNYNNGYWNGISKMKEIVFYPQSVGISKSGVENNINTEYAIY